MFDYAINKRAWKKRMKKMGICPSCGCRKAEPGLVNCRVCNVAAKETWARYYKAHAEALRKNKLERYYYRKDNRLCVICGRPLDEEDVIVMCGGCQDPSPQWAHHNQDPVMLMHAFGNRG